MLVCSEMNAKNLIVVAVVVACLAVAANAMCAKWGVRDCSEKFEDCVKAIPAAPTDEGSASSGKVVDPMCTCFSDLSDCISNYDCDDDAAAFVFHGTCISYKNGTCGTEICREGASTLGFPLVVLILSAIFYLLF